jgi:hypothetical protein
MTVFGRIPDRQLMPAPAQLLVGRLQNGSFQEIDA